MPNTYKEETYKEVCCWTADTKIKYAPNPKSGKSKVRYAGYEKANTVGQALALRSYPQDLFFDYEHGYIKVLGGPRRKTPLDLKDEDDTWTKVDKMLAKMHRAWQTWKKTFEVANKMGVDRRQLTADKVQAESTEVRCKRLAALAMAKMVLEDAKKTRRKLTEHDVLAVLRLWGFRENTTRQNVMEAGREYVYSDTLGLVAGYDGSVMVTAATTEYAPVAQVFCGWLKDHLPPEFRKHGFGFSSINVNANYAGKLHRDGSNEGPSMIKAFGKFSGGTLNYWADDDKREGTVESLCHPGYSTALDLSKNLALFDGNRGHSVNAFKGERYSLVFFCVGLYQRANKAVQSELARCGIEFPSKESMAFARSCLGSPCGYKKALKMGEDPAKMRASAKDKVRCWPVADKVNGVDFLSAKKAAEAKKISLCQDRLATNCSDKVFVDYKINYELLPDGRRGVRVFLVGSSGGLKLAVTADEEQKGAARYNYEKAAGFKLGPPLNTSRITDVREWVAKVIKKTDGKLSSGSKKRCIRSNSSDDVMGSLKASKRLRTA